MHNPFRVVEMFEENLCEYTGAKYAVCVNSCTAALELALLWERKGETWFPEIDVPEKTYTSVPMVANWAGYKVVWAKNDWRGEYRLHPTRVWDSAKRLKRGMYRPGMFQCLSFHPQKPLALPEGGGCILHDNEEADIWFRKMRHDGRTQHMPTKDDVYYEAGLHCYMMPCTAAAGLHALSIYAFRGDGIDMPSELEKYPGPENHKWMEE